MVVDDAWLLNKATEVKGGHVIDSVTSLSLLLVPITLIEWCEWNFADEDNRIGERNERFAECKIIIIEFLLPPTDPFHGNGNEHHVEHVAVKGTTNKSPTNESVTTIIMSGPLGTKSNPPPQEGTGIAAQYHTRSSV